MTKLYSIIAAAAIAVISVACSESGPEYGCGNITVGASMAQADAQLTKGPLSQADLVGGSTILVYDILPDDSKPRQNFTAHIDGKTATKGSGGWSFSSSYPWVVGTPLYTSKTDHNFFGWLTREATGNLSLTDLFTTTGTDPEFAVTPSQLDSVYTVSISKTMTLNVAQFDFCYSDLVHRKKENNNYSIVPLHLHHLFACFGISARNYTSSKVTITSIKLHGLVNNKTAEIVYNTGYNKGTTEISYSPADSNPKSWTTDANALELVGSSIVLNAEDETGASVANVITSAAAGSHPSNAATYFLMWPQTDAEMDNTVRKVSDAWTYDSPDEPVLVVTYTTAGNATPVTVPLPIRPASLDGSGWDAGTKHCIELAFTEKTLDLADHVKNWDYIDQAVDYTQAATASVEGRLTFSGCIFGTGSYSNCIYFKNGNPITGYFKLDGPEDATWMIAKDGDFDVFEIDNRDTGEFGDGIDVNYGTIDGNTAYFTIYPKITDPKRDYSITLSFTVRTATGNVINVDQLVQPKVEGTPAAYVTQDGEVVVEKRTIVLQAS